ncbi:MAG: hypothetical protein ACLQDY_12845 [Streptosporangiaceae bacterium]
MTDDDLRLRLRIHEAGHQVAGLAAGRESLGVTIVGGEHARGCGTFRLVPIPPGTIEATDTRSFLVWPPVLRADIETRALTYLAGPLAADLLTPELSGGHLPADLAEAAADLAADLADPDPGHVAGLRSTADTPGRDDLEEVAFLARVAYPGDDDAREAWMGYMVEAASAFVRAEAASVWRLAALLAERDTLDGAQVAACLTGRTP